MLCSYTTLASSTIIRWPTYIFFWLSTKVAHIIELPLEMKDRQGCLSCKQQRLKAHWDPGSCQGWNERNQTKHYLANTWPTTAGDAHIRKQIRCKVPRARQEQGHRDPYAPRPRWHKCGHAYFTCNHRTRACASCNGRPGLDNKAVPVFRPCSVPKTFIFGCCSIFVFIW